MSLRLVTRPAGESYQTLTLVAAVSTVLVVRVFLELTGYPQVGTSTLHIAHVLWGGLLMLVAGRLSLSFYGEGARRASAALLGVGFGLFVDEIGKFITQDNDYFFRPAAALIYASFILLFLASRLSQRLVPLTDRTLLCSAIEHLGEVARGDFEAHERASALASLDRVAAESPTYRDFARRLRSLVEEQEPMPLKEQHPLARRIRAFRRRLQRSPLYFEWLLRALVAAALFGLVKTGLQALLVLATVLGLPLPDLLDVQNLRAPESDFTIWVLQALASVLAASYLLRGLWALRSHPRIGLFLLARGYTVSVLFVDVFTFYFNQFGATVDVLVNLLILGAIHQLMRETAASVRLAPAAARMT